MIGRIHGVLLEKQLPEVLIDVQGVGYEVLIPMSSAVCLPAMGGQITLFTHFVVREDAQLLFGFASKQERSLFRDLVKVNGVGPKLALAILSGMETEDFVRCVQQNDSKALVKIPGVGNKTAERLVLDMRDRLKNWQLPGSASAMESLSLSVHSIVEEAESALIALGYKPQEASKAVAKANQEQHDSSESLIRQALKNMVKT